MVLEVDAFAGGVGGEQDADGRVLGVGLESGFDALAVVRVHAAVEGQERSPSVKPSVGEEVVSHFWVARYSVKMMTRSWFHWPSGRRWSLSHCTSCFALVSSCADGALRPVRHLLSRVQFLGGRLAEEPSWRYPRRRAWLRRTRRRRRSLHRSGRSAG